MLYPDLIQISKIARSIQATLIAHQIPPPVSKPEVLPGFQLLRANLGLQGDNEMLNNMYNIIWQNNSQGIEER